MVSHKLCFVCKYRGGMNGTSLCSNNIYCAYLTDTGHKPEGYTVDGEWRRKASGMNCPEFCAGQPPKRNMQGVPIPEDTPLKFKHPEDWSE